jgi:fructokinase
VTTLVVGEALIDIVQGPGGQQEHLGGSPANVAQGLARLGHPVSLATHLGADERGRQIATHLADAGVQVLPGSDSAARTSTATAQVDSQGMATYSFDLTWDVPAVNLSNVAHVHTGSIAATLEPGASHVLDLVRQARATCTVSYDPNLRASIMGTPHEVRSRVEEVIGYSDVVKASAEDVEWLYAGAPVAEVARLWGQLGPSVVVVTQGAEGALLLMTDGGEQAVLPAPSAAVVDTVGAGDSFMSGLLSGLLDADLLGNPDTPPDEEAAPSSPPGGPPPGGPPPGGPPPARGRLRSSRLHAILHAVERGLACSHWTIERAGAAAPTRSDLTG